MNSAFVKGFLCQYFEVAHLVGNNLMTIIYYDADGSAGTGTIYFEDIEGGIPIVAHQLIANDYVVDITPPSGFVTNIVARWWLSIKVKDFGAAKPFTSTPEVRYKLGTLVPVRAYDIVAGESGEEIFAFYGSPEFLIYERTRSQDFVVQVSTDAPGFENYQIIFGNYGPFNKNVALREIYIDTDSFRGLQSTMGLDVNLTDGVVVDIQMDYTFVTQFTSNTDTRQKVTVNL